MQDDHAVGGRQSPAERVAVTLESMPPVRPVEPVLAQQFSNILTGAGRSPAYLPQQEGAQDESCIWDKLTQHGFLMADQMLDAERVSRQDGGNQNDQEKQGAFSPDEADTIDIAGTDQTDVRRLPILRLGAMLLAENNAGPFVNALTDFIAAGRNFGATWHLELVVSSEQLSQTRLFIDCDEIQLHLRFVCVDLNTHHILEKNIALLQDSLRSVSLRPVLVEISRGACAENSAGAKGVP